MAKRVLITGAHSYIGTNVEEWLNNYNNEYKVTVISVHGDRWKQYDFHTFDCVLHVAGIAHADISRVSDERKREYYRVNCDLAVEVARKAKADGVKQFIYMSSLLIYGDNGNGSYHNKMIIRSGTRPNPTNFYGDSKYQAEKRLERLSDDSFKVAIIRSPMIYGKGCRGNYNSLVKIALRTICFPKGSNRRSVLYIRNLCEFIRLLIDHGDSGIYWPQNKEYVRTSDFIRVIARVHNHPMMISNKMNWLIEVGSLQLGKIGRLTNKAFGSLVIDKELSSGKNMYYGSYQIYSFIESIVETEGIQ